MEHVAVLLEHVDLLDTGDGLDTELLERGLELAVVTLGGGHRLLDLLTAGSALAAWRSDANGSDEKAEQVRV